MRVLTIDVAGRETVNKRFKSAMAGKEQGEFLSFPSLETLHRLLNPRRFGIVEAVQKWGPVGVRELARRLEKDPGNLTRDLKSLKEWGLVEESEGGLVVPYDEIRLELVIRKVA